MRRKLTSVLLSMLIASSLWAAIPAGTCWEVRTTGAQTNGGGFVWTSLVNATYRWTASASGTNEYYCELAAGGNPSLTASGSVCTDGNYNLATEGTAGSLTAGQYDWADNDTLGYTTLYVRLSNGLDPDTMIARGQPGYVSYGAGGTDYSQQATAQRSWLAAGGTYTNNLSITNATPSVVTSASYNFTDADKNNIIYLSAGTNVTVGWYHIVSVAANAATLDRNAMTGAPSADASGYEGGAFAFGGSLDFDFKNTGQKAAGNTIYISGNNAENTTFTLGENVTGGVAGTSALPMYWIGYRAARGDNCLGAYRPLIDCGSFYFLAGSYHYTSNLQFTGTAARVLYLSGNASVYNCKATNTSGTAGRDAIASGGAPPVILVGCEAVSTVGNAFNGAGADVLIGCYFHDSDVGVVPDPYTLIEHCVIDSCTGTTGTGITAVTASNIVVSNCTIYGCGIGVSGTTAAQCTFVNNIISGNTTGATWTNQLDSNQWLFNCWNNTTDVSDIVLGRTNTFADPGLNAPATGDFSITSTDTNVYEQGVDVGYFTSATTYTE